MMRGVTTARAPASSANLGPGFDCLAVALQLYVEVSVEPAEEFSITSEGEGAHHTLDRNHYAARIAIDVAGHDRLAIRVKSDIPLGRGLGSSAALAAAAAAAAGAASPLEVATEADGHADNAAASVLGGLVVAARVDGRIEARRLPLDPEITFVVLVPDHELPTAEARAALPTDVPHADARFNLARLGLLVAGLADRSQLVSDAMADRLHQPQRGRLFPAAARLLDDLVEAGALASCWSGAGPSLLAVCERSNAERVRQAGEDSLSVAGVAGHARILDPDVRGLTIEGAPPGDRRLR